MTLEKKQGVVLFTNEAIEKLFQFLNETENANEKYEEIIKNRAAKELEIFSFSDGKNGLETL